MTRILGLDTSVQTCSVALLDNGVILARSQHLAKGHSRLILPMIDGLLSEAGLALAQLDAVALTIGPGSFTGLRIAISVVQGLAFGANLPVVAVSTLQTMAAGAIKRHRISERAKILPAFDARMGEIYWGLYQNIGGTPVSCAADAVAAPETVGLCADGLTRADSIALGVGGGWQYAAQFPVTAQTIQTDCQPAAEDLIPLALSKYLAGEALPIDRIEPVYLRDTVSWKKRSYLRPQG